MNFLNKKILQLILRVNFGSVTHNQCYNIQICEWLLSLSECKKEMKMFFFISMFRWSMNPRQGFPLDLFNGVFVYKFRPIFWSIN